MFCVFRSIFQGEALNVGCRSVQHKARAPKVVQELKLCDPRKVPDFKASVTD